MQLRSFAVAGALAAIVSTSANAFNYFPVGPAEDGFASKWGSNAVGTPGGVVTWSLIKDGTGIDANLALSSDFTGTSNLTSIFDQVGGEAAAITMLHGAFAAWSAVANVQFQFLGTEDGSVPFGAPYAPNQNIGDIRIGAYDFPGFSAGQGFAAPPNGGTTLEGDIVFNTNGIDFFVAPGNEGDLYGLFPNGTYHNDFQGLAAHEIGHALGLAHTDVTTALMCGDGAQCYWIPDLNGEAPITRLPKADDIAGIQFLYGPAPVPEPHTWILMFAGIGLVGLATRRRRTIAV